MTTPETTNNCPKCGKPMTEQAFWSGMWVCPDYKQPLNETPPYKFKCTGMYMEPHAAQEFARACWAAMAGGNN